MCFSKFANGSSDRNDKFAILSPEVFPILPQSQSKNKKQILSPRMFSFYKDGFFSLQELFKAERDSG
ncbi:unnamed protein product, partial [Mesorhabditis spiculigera]